VTEPRDPGRERWRETTRAKAVGQAPERRERFATSSDIEVQDVYTPADLEALGFDPARDLGLPGEYPFTRGVQPTMYRSRFWTMRQYAGFATAEETNQRFRYLLEHGQTGLSVAFDLPTQMGYDSDSPEAAGEVGRVGVPISSLADMEVLLDGLPLDEVSTSMTINSTAAILLALYVAAAEKRGVARDRISGTTQNDILKEYIARGTWIYPPRPSMRLVTDIFEFCARELPRWNTISISGYHMREAGATAAQELAFTLADAIAYCDAAIARGLPIDEFAGRLSFAAWSELFEEVAKFRAARRMWARIVKDRFGATSERSMMCRFHVQTAGSSLTAQSIDNNVVRTTVQALSAVLGGAQSLHTNARDEALALPTEESARLALRTQQILAHESGVTDTPDPLAGSYFVESLTTGLEVAAQGYLDEIEAMGGTLAAIEGGFQQRQIQESAYRVQQAIERGDQVVVGVNKFRDDAAPSVAPAIQRIDPEGERRQIERVRRVRAERDPAAWERTLLSLEEHARAEENLMPALIEAVKAYATVGEIANRLRAAWGVHRELITV
jgi:methylmalonyl-CoA mutase N-terminal domain/subunit